MRMHGAGWMAAGLACLAILAADAAQALPGGSPGAGLDAAAILERMEKTINGFQDQEMDVRFTIVDVDGSRKSYDFTIQQKGAQKRMIRFTSGELKDMATLVEDRNRVYVYLPGFKKVRRVAAHNMNQTFAGSDFTTDDMASPSWTAMYDAALIREEPDRYVVSCTPKAGVENVPYAKAVLEIDSRSFQQLSVEYFDAAGRKLKVMKNTDMRTFHGVMRAGRVTLTDARTGHRTELEIVDLRVNRGIPDSAFSVRELEWAK